MNTDEDRQDKTFLSVLIRVHLWQDLVCFMICNRTRCLSYLLLACMAVFGLAAAEHHGQVKFGGLPVPGATVTATQGDKKQVAVTDTQGLYSFPDLADGVWTIDVEMLCFESLKKDIGVTAEAPSPEFDLKLLPLDQLKAVAAAAPASQEADDKYRSSAPLTTTSTPAPTNAKSNNKKSSAAPANPQSGFQRTDVNASPDAAPADSGLASAAADPNANASDAFVLNGSVSNRIESRAIGNVRKGPRSWYSGNLNFIMDNSALDARAFSLTGQNTAKPAYNHLQLGGSFGGPLYIPHVLKSNGQFFLGFQTMRNRNASTVSGLMPTEAERNGDFSGVTNLLGQPVRVFDPNTGTLGNTISKISAQAKALLALYPKPGFPQSGGYNYQIATVGRTTQNQVVSRANRNLNSKNFVNGQFAWQGSDTTSPNIFGFVDSTAISGLTTTATYRHIFTTRFNGSLTYTYSRQATRVTPYFEGLNQNIAGNAGITGDDQSPENYGPPALNFTSSGIQGLSDAQHAFTRNQTSAIGFTGMWMPRPHNLTFGVDFRRQQSNYLSQANPRGSFSFTGAATAAAGVPGSGNDFADFLLGIPDTSSIAYGNADKYQRSNLWDAYVTDDWRIGPTLTLNVGIRWEYSSPVSELYGRLVNLDIANGFAAESPVLGRNPVGPLTGQRYPGSLVRPGKHGFGPRAAFAWHPFAGSSMVVRGGYGIYYNTSVYQSIANQMMQQSPLSKSFTVANSPADPLTLANGFIASPTTTQNTFAFDPRGLCAELSVIGAEGPDRLHRWDHHVPRSQGHPRGSGVSAQHVSHRRRESVSLVCRGLYLHDLEWKLHARIRHVATAPPDAQRLRGQRPVHVLPLSRRRGARWWCGHSAELAQPERRARPIEFRSAPRGLRHGAIHQRHGPRRRSALERLGGQVGQGLDLRRDASSRHGLAGDSHLLPGSAGHRSHWHPAGRHRHFRVLPCFWPQPEPRRVHRPSRGPVGQRRT